MSDSLDIDFVHVVIHSRSYKNTHLPHVVVSIVGVLAQFLWEAQAHKVSGRYIIGNC